MTARRIGSAVSMPWGLFVAVFLYYVGLTLLALGADQLSEAFVAVSYLLPVAVYAALLVKRAVRRLVGMPVELWPTPNLVLH